MSRKGWFSANWRWRPKGRGGDRGKRTGHGSQNILSGFILPDVYLKDKDKDIDKGKNKVKDKNRDKDKVSWPWVAGYSLRFALRDRYITRSTKDKKQQFFGDD